VTTFLAALAVLATVVTPFAVEWFKGTRTNEAQAHISGINAWAEEVVPTSPACPTGYCHLKYVIRNNSSNEIRQVAVVQPGRDKLNYIPAIQAGAPQYEEVDPGLRRIDPSFAGYPVEIIFTDSRGRTWHKHRITERVRSLVAHPSAIRDYEPYRNPVGINVVTWRVLSTILALAVVAALSYGIVKLNTSKETPGTPAKSGGAAAKQRTES